LSGDDSNKALNQALSDLKTELKTIQGCHIRMELNNMKWFKPYECDNTVKNPFVCDYSNIDEYGYSKWDLLKGEAIKDWDDTIIFQSEKRKNDGNPDDVLQNHLGIPIYSERLITALNINNITGIQYLKIKVLRSDNTSMDGFCVINFLNFVEAFDYDKSDYDRFSDDFPNPNVRGKISGVRKFILHKEKLNNFDIIRLKDYDLRYFVSEKFRKIFVDNKFTGYFFEEVELT
jgi:hypothetical protein